jgi:hypothetical protein
MVVGVPRIISMSTTRSRQRPQSPPEDQATNWFLTLEIAETRGDVEAAAEARRELERLGWTVTRRRSRRKAAGREADHA